jgi:hypothetical protein
VIPEEPDIKKLMAIMGIIAVGHVGGIDRGSVLAESIWRGGIFRKR